MPYENAISRELVIHPGTLLWTDPVTGSPLSAPHAAAMGMIAVKDGMVSNPQSGELMLYSEALKRGLLVKSSDILVKDPQSGELVSLSEGADRGFVYLATNEIRDLETGDLVSFSEGLSRGLVLQPHTTLIQDALTRGVISVTQAVEGGIIDKATGTVKDPTTLGMISIKEGVDTGVIIEPNDLLIQNPEAGGLVTLSQAAKQGLVDLNNGNVRDPKTGQVLTFKEALEQGLLLQKKAAMFQDPYTGRLLNADEAEREGLVNLRTGEVIDPITHQMIPYNEAILRGVLLQPITARVKDSATGGVIGVKEAVKRGVLDVHSGAIVDPITHERITMKEAIQAGLVVLPGERAMSYPSSSVKSETSESSSEMETDRDVTPLRIEESSDDCLQTSRRPRTLSRIPENEETGTVPTAGARKVDVADITPVIERPPIGMALVDAIEGGVMDSKTGRFEDPFTGKEMSFQEAIEKGFVDIEQAQVRVPGYDEPVLLRKAMTEGLVDETSGQITDVKSGRRISMNTAVQKGFLKQSPSAPTLQDVSEKGLYDMDTGMVIDERSGRQVPLEEAIEENLIDRSSVKVEDPSGGGQITLSEAFQKGIMDPDTSSIVDSKTGKTVSIVESVKRGLLAVVAAPVVGPVYLAKLAKDKLSEKSTKTDPESESEMEFQKSEMFTGEIETSASRDKRIVSETHSDMVQKPTATETVHEKVYSFGGITGTEIKTGKKVEVGGSIHPGKVISGDMERPQEVMVREMVSHTSTDVSTKADEFNKGQKYETPHDIDKKGQTPEGEDLMESQVTVEPGRKPSDDKSQIKAKTEEQDGKTVTESLEKDIVTTARVVSSDAVVSKTSPMETDGDRDTVKQDVAIVHAQCETMPDYTWENLDTSEAKSILDIAIMTGKIGLVSKIIDTNSDEALTIKEAIDRGIMHPRTGAIVDKVTGRSVPLLEAIEGNVLVREEWPVTLTEALNSGAYDVDTNLFIEPGTGQKLTLQEVVEKGYVDSEHDEIVDPGSGDIISLHQAFRRGLFDVKTGEMVDRNSGKRFTLMDAMQEGFIVQSDGSERLDTEQQMEIITEGPQCPSLVEIIEESYDARRNTVVDPVTGRRMSLKRAVAEGVADTSDVFVRDPFTGQEVPLSMLVEMGQVDLSTGLVIDSSGERIPIGTAVKEGVLFDSKNDKRDGFPVNGLPLKQMFSDSLYDPDTGQFTDPITSEKITLVEALDRRVVDEKSVVVNEPKSGEVFNIREAINNGVVNGKTSKVKDRISKEKVPLTVAMSRGILIARPMALETAIDIGLYNEATGKFLDPTCGQFFALEQAIMEGLIDEETSTITDPVSGKELLLAKATAIGVLDARNGNVVNVHTGETFTLKEAVKAKLPVRKRQMSPIPLHDAMKKGIYDSERNVVVDPETEAELTLEEALSTNVIDNESYVCDPVNGTRLTLTEATQRGILDSSAGTVTDIDIGDKLALSELLSEPPLPIAEVVKRHLYSPDTNTVRDPVSKEDLSLGEALQRGVVDVTSTLEDPSTRELVTVQEAITCGIFDVQTGRLVNRKTREETTLVSGIPSAELEKSPSQIMPLLSLHQAFKQGLYDPEFNSVTNPITGERLSLEDAIEKGVIDPRSKVVDPFRERTVTLEDAVESGMLDTNIGLVISTKVGESLSLQEAFNQGLMVPTNEELQTLTLGEAIGTGVISESTGLFQDPNSLQDITIPSAVKLGVLSLDNVCVKEPHSDKFVSIPEAAQLGFYNPETCEVQDSADVPNLALVDAWRKNLIIEEKGLTWNDIIEQGLYSEQDGSVTHPQTGDSCSMIDAIKSGLIDTENSHVQVPSSREVITLKEAVSRGMVDPSSGALQQPGEDETVPLHKALIVKTSASAERSPGHTMQEIIENGWFNTEDGTITDNKTGREMTLTEAIREGFVDGDQTLLEYRGNQLTLKDAIREELVDPLNAVFMDPTTGSTVPLSQTIIGHFDQLNTDPSETGVSHDIKPSEPLTLQELIEGELLDETTGMVSHPVGGRMSLKDALDQGMIDASSTLIREPDSCKIISIEDAVYSGVFDSETGIIRDSSSGRVFRLKEAFDEGLVISSREPQLSLQEVVNAGLVDQKSGKIINPQSGSKMDLSEAIQSGLLDSTQMVMKGSESQEEVPLADAVEHGEILLKDNNLVFIQKGAKVPSMENAGSELTQEKLSMSDVLQKDLFSEETGKVIHPDTGARLTLEAAIDSGVIDPNSIKIRDPQTADLMAYQEAVTQGVLDPTTGDVMSPDGEPLTFKEAVHSGLAVVSSDSQVNLIEAVRQGLYHPDTGLITDPETEEDMTVKEAIEKGVVDIQGIRIRDPHSGAELTVEAASESCLIDLEKGTIENPHTGKPITLGEAIVKDLLIVGKPPKFSLHEAYEEGIVDPNTGMLRDPFTGEDLGLAEAIERDILDPNKTIVRHPGTGKMVPLDEAIAIGLIDDTTGQYIDQTSRARISFQDATETGSILNIDENRKHTLIEAIMQGFFNQATASIVDPQTDETMQLAAAIRSGVFAIDNIRVHFHGSDVITFKEAIETGVLDLQNGILTEPQTQKKLELKRAVEDGVVYDIVEGIQVISLKGAVEKGKVDLTTGCITHPKTGAHLTLDQAFHMGLLIREDKPMLSWDTLSKLYYNKDSGVITDPSSKKDINIAEAVDTGVMDDSTVVIVDPVTGKELQWTEAVETKVVNCESGEIRDKDNKYVTLKEAVDKGLVHGAHPGKSLEDSLLEHNEVQHTEPQHVPQELDKGDNSEETMNREQVSDEKTWQTSDKTQKIGETHRDMEVKTQPMKELVHYENLSVREAVHVGILNANTGKLLPTDSTEELNVEEGIDAGILSPDKSVIVLPSREAPLTLKQAILEGVMDPVTGIIRDPFTRQYMNLTKALDTGVVMEQDSVSKGKTTLAELVEAGFYDPKTGQIIHPKTSNVISIQEAVDQGLIDADHTMVALPGTQDFISLSEALECGILDKRTGAINNMLTGEVLELPKSLDLGYIKEPKRQKSVKTQKDGDSVKYDETETQMDFSISDRNDAQLIHSEREFIDYKAQEEPDGIKPEKLQDNADRFRDSVAEIVFGVEDSFIKDAATTAVKLEKEKGLYEIDSESSDKEKGEFPANEQHEQGNASEKLSDEPESVQLEEQMGIKINRLKIETEEMETDLKQTVTTADTPSEYHQEQLVGDMNVKSEEPFDAEEKDGETQGRLTEKQPPSIDSTREDKITLHMAAEDKRNVSMLDKNGEPLVPVSPSDEFEILQERKGMSQIEDLEQLSKKSHFGQGEGLQQHSENIGRAAWEIQRDSDISIDDSPEQLRMELKDAVEDIIFSGKVSDGSASHEPEEPKELEPQKSSGKERGHDDDEEPPRGLTLPEAHKQGLIDAESSGIRDPSSDKMMSIEEAISSGLIDERKTFVINPKGGKPMTLTEAIDIGLIDAKDNKVIEPKYGQRLEVVPAINARVITDPTTIAAEHQVSDPGLLKDNDTTNIDQSSIITSESQEPSNSREQSLVVEQEVISALTISEAIDSGLLDGATGVFSHPYTDEELTFKQALDRGFLVSDSVKVTVPDAWKSVPLLAAINEGLVDGKTGHIFENEGSKTLSEAVLKGQIWDDDDVQEQPMTITDAYHQGQLDGSSGRFKGRECDTDLDFGTAVARGHLLPDETVVNLPGTIKSTSVIEALRSGLMDSETGSIFDAANKKMLSVGESIAEGVLVEDKIVTPRIDQPDRLPISETAAGHDANDQRDAIVSSQTQSSLTMDDDSVKEHLTESITSPDSAVPEDLRKSVTDESDLDSQIQFSDIVSPDSDVVERTVVKEMPADMSGKSVKEVTPGITVRSQNRLSFGEISPEKYTDDMISQEDRVTVRPESVSTLQVKIITTEVKSPVEDSEKDSTIIQSSETPSSSAQPQPASSEPDDNSASSATPGSPTDQTEAAMISPPAIEAQQVTVEPFIGFKVRFAIFVLHGFYHMTCMDICIIYPKGLLAFPNQCYLIMVLLLSNCCNLK